MGAPSHAAVLVLDELAEGGNSFAFEIGAGELGLEHEFLSFAGALQVRLQVRRSLDDFSLEGEVSCALRGECYRCLEPLEEPLRARLDLLLQRRRASAEELAAAAEDGFIEIVDPGTREVDVRPYVREAVVLELPMRIPSPVLGGICPHCGEGGGEGGAARTGGTDPRWEALKDLFTKENSERST